MHEPLCIDNNACTTESTGENEHLVPSVSELKNNDVCFIQVMYVVINCKSIIDSWWWIIEIDLAFHIVRGM